MDLNSINYIPFYVLNWDFNTKNIEAYDIMKPLLYEYFEEKEKEKHYWGREKHDDMPTTLEDLMAFIEGYALNRWWSRCEYEIIVKQWPPADDCEKKTDIYAQVLMNMKVIAITLQANLYKLLKLEEDEKE